MIAQNLIVFVGEVALDWPISLQTISNTESILSSISARLRATRITAYIPGVQCAIVTDMKFIWLTTSAHCQ